MRALLARIDWSDALAFVAGLVLLFVLLAICLVGADMAQVIIMGEYR